MTFEKDLKVGKQIENEILGIIQEKYPLAHLIGGFYEEFDIFVPEVSVGVEVKYDRKSSKTGNYIIETSSSGKPSGIKVTKADWWVQVSAENICWIRTENLRYLLREEKAPEIPYFLDGREKTGYLIDKEILRYSLYTLMGDRKSCKTVPF